MIFQPVEAQPTSVTNCGTKVLQSSPGLPLNAHIPPPSMAKILGRIVFRASRNLRVSGINASSISPASLADRVAIKQGILWGCANRSSELYQGSAHTRHTFSSGATRLADDSSVSISGKANRNPEKEGRSRTLREGANKNPELYVSWPGSVITSLKSEQGRVEKLPLGDKRAYIDMSDPLGSAIHYDGCPHHGRLLFRYAQLPPATLPSRCKV